MKKKIKKKLKPAIFIYTMYLKNNSYILDSYLVSFELKV